MTDVLNVVAREAGGKRAAARLRRTGMAPAVLYGHGQENVNLALKYDELLALVRHGGRVVDLAGAVSEKALVRDLQWDTFGQTILHVDLARVSVGERVEVEVPVELRGEARGQKEGGHIEHVLHEVEIECPATEIPEKLVLRIADLGLDEYLHASDLELPEGVKLLTEPDAVVVHCALAKEEAEVEPGAAATAEPEVIKRKAGEEEGEEGE